MKINEKFIDDRIIKLLSDRGISSKEDLTDYLFPSLNKLRDPFLLTKMREVTERINFAIENNETIVIYGDYDCDGISASSMLYLYLKSRGIEANVFIPDRFSDGYGISEKTINDIAENCFPDLLITVDCGISANSQVEQLNEIGIDVIVTDHHEATETLPDCLIIDPKLPNQEYGFNGLSGAGVVFKLIHALGGIDEALKYIDICAISTVGDIVPLLDENRIITYYGLKDINSPNARPFIKNLKQKLDIETITSSELSFKIVPRLNASGRIDNCKKCFEYFVAEDKETLDSKYIDIDADNTERLRSSNESFEKISSQINNIDFNKNPAIFIYEPSINLGIIGIIASKLCSQYHRPVFVLADAENGLVKGSVRSVPGINIFDILLSEKELLSDVGGHELAGGLTVPKENLRKLEQNVQFKISKFDSQFFEIPFEYDIEITEKDINLQFANQLAMLEPFGHKNKKPVVMLEADEVDFIQMKSFRHYKILTKSKKEIVCFFGTKYASLFSSLAKKQISFEMDIDEFGGQKRTKCILKNARSLPEFNFSQNDLFATKMVYWAYLGLGQKRNSKLYNSFSEIKNLCDQKYQTLVVADDKDTFGNCKKYLELETGVIPSVSGKSMIVYAPYNLLDKSSVLFYKNIIFASGYTFNELPFIEGKNCYVYNSKQNLFDVVDRTKFAEIFKFIKGFNNLSCNNFIDLCQKISNNSSFSLQSIALCICVSAELNFLALESTIDTITLKFNKNSKKRELSESKIYSQILSEKI